MSIIRPVFEVQIDGSAITGVTSVSASFGIEQDNGACTVEGVDLSSVGVARDTLVVYGGDGSYTTADKIFNGEVIEPEYDLWPRKTTIVGQDAMARLRAPWGNGYYEYVSQTAGDIETNLIEKSGIDVSLHVVVDSGRVLGSVGNELKLRDGTPQGIDPNGGAADVPLTLIRNLLELDLYYMTTRSNGAVYIDALATTTAVATYSGAGLRQFRWRPGNPNEIINKVLVKGLEILTLSYQGEYDAASSYLPAPASFQTKTITNPLIESDSDCVAIATAWVTLYNRLIKRCTFTVDGNLAIQPGKTVSFASAGLSATAFFIEKVTHTIGSDFTTSGTGIAL